MYNSHIDQILGAESNYLSSYECLCDDTDKLGVDYTLRFEHLEEDWDNMFKVLNIDTPQLPKINVSNEKKHYSEYYTGKTKQEMIDLVHLFYEKDFKYFGYKFEEK